MIFWDDMCWFFFCLLCVFFVFFQAEDGIRDLVRSRGLGDVYKRQVCNEYYNVLLIGNFNWRKYCCAQCRSTLNSQEFSFEIEVRGSNSILNGRVLH